MTAIQQQRDRKTSNASVVRNAIKMTLHVCLQHACVIKTAIVPYAAPCEHYAGHTRKRKNTSASPQRATPSYSSKRSHWCYCTQAMDRLAAINHHTEGAYFVNITWCGFLSRHLPMISRVATVHRHTAIIWIRFANIIWCGFLPK